MKRIFSVLLLCGIALAGCNNNQRIQVAETSLYLSDSLCTIDTKKSVFSSENRKLGSSLDELNDYIDGFYNAQSDSIQMWAGEHAGFLEQEILQSGEEHTGIDLGYELIMRDSLFYSSDELVSLRFMTYTYTRGAHGNTFYTAVNYAPRNLQFLTTANILNVNESAKINELLAKHFNNKDNCFGELPVLEKASAINVSRNFVIFTFDQYVLGAYVCGPAVVQVPLAEIQPYMILKLGR